MVEIVTRPKHPRRLTQDAIAEALVEIRFPGGNNAEAVLPGLLFHNFEGGLSKIEALPFANMPLVVRQSDANLQFMPVHRLSGEGFSITVGDRVLGISSHPYMGWERFSELISKVFGFLAQSTVVAAVERYSLKYTNFIEASPGSDVQRLFNLDFRLGSLTATRQPMQFRIENQDGPNIDIIQLLNGGVFEDPSRGSLEGAMLDLDCIHMQPSKQFLNEGSDELNKLHARIKAAFFDIISMEWTNERGPIYD